MSSPAELLAARRKRSCAAQVTSYALPIVITHAQAQYIYGYDDEEESADGGSETIPSKTVVTNARRDVVGNVSGESVDSSSNSTQSRRIVRWLDAYNNVQHIGHSHPNWITAVTKQMQLTNLNTRYLHPKFADIAERLCSTLPEPLRSSGVCFFVNSGSEANDLAWRLATQHTGGTECITLRGSYHGSTLAAALLSDTKTDGRPGSLPQPPWLHKVDNPDVYRGRFRVRSSNRLAELRPGDSDATFFETPEGCGAAFGALVGDCIESEIAADGKRLAAFICESVQGCAGQILPPQGYLKKAYEHVRASGGLCVADEVQVGFGRCGKCYWGFQMYCDVCPDIVTMGKPMGNGHPIGCVIARAEIAESFKQMEYFSTFGGNPVSLAACEAVLDAVEQEQLQTNADVSGEHFMARLRELQCDFECIGDVRGSGLYVGVEFIQADDDQASGSPLVVTNVPEPSPELAKWVCEFLKGPSCRILSGVDGPFNNVLRFKPPLCFTCENGEEVVSGIRQALIAWNTKK